MFLKVVLFATIFWITIGTVTQVMVPTLLKTPLFPLFRKSYTTGLLEKRKKAMDNLETIQEMVEIKRLISLAKTLKKENNVN